MSGVLLRSSTLWRSASIAGRHLLRADALHVSPSHVLPATIRAKSSRSRPPPPPPPGRGRTDGNDGDGKGDGGEAGAEGARSPPESEAERAERVLAQLKRRDKSVLDLDPNADADHLPAQLQGKRPASVDVTPLESPFVRADPGAQMARELRAESLELEAHEANKAQSEQQIQAWKEEYYLPTVGADRPGLRSTADSGRGALSSLARFFGRVVLVYAVIWTGDHLYQAGYMAYTEYFGIPSVTDEPRRAVKTHADPYGWNEDFLLDHAFARPDRPGTETAWPLWARRDMGHAWYSLTYGGMVPKSIVSAGPERPKDASGPELASYQLAKVQYEAYLRSLARDKGISDAERTISKTLADMDAYPGSLYQLPTVESLEAAFPDTHDMAATVIDASAVAVRTHLSFLRTEVATPSALEGIIKDDAHLVDLLLFVGPRGQRSLGVAPQQAPLLANRVAAACADLGRTDESIKWYHRSLAALPPNLPSSDEATSLASPPIARELITSLLGLAKAHALPPPSQDGTRGTVFSKAMENRLKESLRYQTLAMRIVRDQLERLAGGEAIDAAVTETGVRPHPLISGTPAPDQAELEHVVHKAVLSRSLSIYKSANAVKMAEAMEEGKQLYFAWLLAQDAGASMLLGQTAYALQKIQSTGLIGRTATALRLRSPPAMEETSAWLHEASADAQRIKALLAADDRYALKASDTGMNFSEGTALAEQWAKNPVYNRVALALLQSAQALERSAEGMLGALGASY